MSTKYNHFAKDLDIAFKAARDEYAAAYNTVEQARKAMQDAGPDALKRQISTLQLQEAENKMRTEAARIWAEFDAKAADLRRALEKEVQTSNLADPSAIDSNAVELMKTGVLTVDDYFGFADRYDGNPTMLKLIGHYAKEAADSADDRKDKVALTVLAQDCAKGTGKTARSCSTRRRTTLRLWAALMIGRRSSMCSKSSRRRTSGCRWSLPACVTRWRISAVRSA